LAESAALFNPATLCRRCLVPGLPAAERDASLAGHYEQGACGRAGLFGRPWPFFAPISVCSL
jgi:hypothetical protein